MNARPAGRTLRHSRRLQGRTRKTKEFTMAICLAVDHPHETQEQAQRVIEHVRSSGPIPPDGVRLVLGGSLEPGWRVITVWDSQEALDRFFEERLGPAFESAGLSLDDITRTQFEVYAMVAGDLTGVPQPA